MEKEKKRKLNQEVTKPNEDVLALLNEHNQINHLNFFMCINKLKSHPAFKSRKQYKVKLLNCLRRERIFFLNSYIY